MLFRPASPDWTRKASSHLAAPFDDRSYWSLVLLMSREHEGQVELNFYIADVLATSKRLLVFGIHELCFVYSLNKTIVPRRPYLLPANGGERLLPLLSARLVVPRLNLPTVALDLHITKTSSRTRRRALSPKSSSPSPQQHLPAIDEANLYKPHKVSTQSPISLVHIASFAFLAAVLIFQLLFKESLPITKRSPPSYSPTSFSPPAHIVEGATCESPLPFPTEPPISRPHKMALAAEAKRIAAEFEFSDDDVRRTVAEFIVEMNEGLAQNATTMSQIPTYVTGVPNGTEKGLYLAVDLGGTNFRVCSIQLHGDTTFSLTQSKVAIPKELMVAKTAKELFAFLAKQIELFLKAHHEDHFEAHVRRRQTVSTPEGYRDEHIFRLGFTFSFPVHQIGINRGTLIRWTKGFDIQDAVGQDVCALLQKEIDLLRLPVKVAALVNDTVGTLMARSYTSPGKTGTLLGAIFGTGTNGAYVEKLSKITKPMAGEYDKTTSEMVVNTEWGSFDNGLKVLPNTIYDQILDQDSVNPGIQMFEKRVSGMFLGEILRIVLVKMMKDPSIPLFRDDNSSHNDFKTTASVDVDSPLHTQWAVDSSILSVAEADNSPNLGTLRQFVEKFLGVDAASLEDVQAVKVIAHAIAKRAARLAGVAIGGIVLQTGCLTPGASSIPGPSSAAKIVEEIKAGKLATAASATVNKLADTAGIAVNEDEIVDIGVDGSLVEFYPGFEDYMREALRAMEGIGAAGERRIRIGIAKDGSGVGAALIALVAAKMEKPLDYLNDLKGRLEDIKDDGLLHPRCQPLGKAFRRRVVKLRMHMQAESATANVAYRVQVAYRARATMLIWLLCCFASSSEQSHISETETATNDSYTSTSGTLSTLDSDGELVSTESNATSNQFVYKALDPEIWEIRLLVLLPNPDFSANLCISLKHANLVQKFDYEALSYVWGDPNDTVPLQNGRNPEAHFITKNLELALRYFRLATKPRVLWVDALCISQQDISERNAQVEQMRRIYLKASRVVVWLGEEGESAEALDYCENILQKTEESIGDLSSQILKIGACQKLFTRPWFSRTWILQEVLHHRPVDVHIGRTLVGLDRLCEYFDAYRLRETTIKELKNISLGLPKWGFFSSFEDTLQVRHVVRKIQTIRSEQAGRNPDYISVGAMLIQGTAMDDFRLQQCTDPRDKVYAILGMCYPTNVEIKIDYNASKECVYTMAMKSLLNSEKNALLFVESPERTIDDSQLPSWVPDWTKPQDKILRFMNYVAGGFDASRVGNKLAEQNPERLAMFSIMADNMLVTSGVYIGTVDRIGWGCTGSAAADLLSGSTRLFTYVYQTDRHHEPGTKRKSVECQELEESRTMLNTNWGPFWMEVGDIVILAAICCVPLVLRPQRDYYRFVGGCLLIDSSLQKESILEIATDPGLSPIMHGSAWDEKKLEEFRIR
ncbi:hypothetical protein G7Y89_g8156 [Cudoniella acicularis]|uniref:glucokinase n=1 Tax=Cudoniella acicularis TaxID=354080 RepID=A0A8H4RH57_9HELO|nr:hypothetical protein G7Y89_g8156 [Cudoniella acicularis]